MQIAADGQGPHYRCTRNFCLSLVASLPLFSPIEEEAGSWNTITSGSFFLFFLQLLLKLIFNSSVNDHVVIFLK